MHKINDRLIDTGQVISYKGIPLALSSKFGTISYVSLEGDNAVAQVGQIDKPFRTIQAAVDATPDFGFVYIFTGTYDGQINLTKSVTLFLYGATLRNTSADATQHTITYTGLNVERKINILGVGTIQRTGVTNADTATARAVWMPFLHYIDLFVGGIDVTCTNAAAFEFAKGRHFTYRDGKISITGRGHGIACNEAHNGNSYLFERVIVRTDLGRCLNLYGGSNRAILRDCDMLSNSNQAIVGVDMTFILEGCTTESKLYEALRDYQFGRIRAINSKFIGQTYAWSGQDYIQRFGFQNCDFASKTTFPVYFKPLLDFPNQQEFMNCRLIAHSSATQIFAYVDQYGATSVKFINCTGNKDLPAVRYQSVIRNYIFEETLSDITI